MADSKSIKRRLFSSSTQPDLTASPRTRSFSGLSTLSRRLREEKAEVLELERAAAKSLKIEDKPTVEEEYLEAKQRVFILPESLKSEEFKNLCSTLLQWANSLLHRRRVLVSNIEEDFYDGQVFLEMLEELEGNPTLSDGSVPLGKERKRNLLERALSYFESQYKGEVKWSAEAVFHKDLVETIHLLVAMARHYRCSTPLPKNVSVRAIYVERQESKMIKRRLRAELTGDEEHYGASMKAVADEDVFDRFFQQAPDKVNDVEKSLLTFANRHMKKVGVTLHSIGKQFADGVNFIYLISIAEDFFIPLCSYFVTPMSDEQQLFNLRLVFNLVSEVTDLPDPKLCSPQLILRSDRKAVMRLLYTLFRVYQGLALESTDPLTSV